MEDAAGGLQFVFEEHAGQERPEEPAGELLGDPGRRECGPRGVVVGALQGPYGTEHVAGGQRGDGEQIAGPRRGAAHQARDRTRRAGGVGEADPAGFGVDEEPRCERAKAQVAQREAAFRLRVGGVEDLEAPVDDEAVDAIGTHSSAGRVRRLPYVDGQTARQEIVRAGQTGQARSDHQDVGGGT